MRVLLSAVLFIAGALYPVRAQEGIAGAYHEFRNPEDSTRTKVWWFHGETETTREGITADLEAYRRAGVGGIVYYDQVHGNCEGAFDAFSPEWWEMLKFSAAEARRLSLSFEINISNGYVAGGPWITEESGMQRLCSSETIVKGGRTLKVTLPRPNEKGWFKDIAVLAFPLEPEYLEDKDISDSLEYDGKPFTARSITYIAAKARKSRNGAMQYPDGPAESFYGMGYVEPGLAGTLECSDDGVNYRKVCDLPTPGGASGLAERTIAFEPVKARHFRINAAASIKAATLSSCARIDRWQEKANYFSEFHDAGNTPEYAGGAIDLSAIIDLTERMRDDGSLVWKAPRGSWVIMRVAAEATRGSTKHGRKNLLGFECDKMSAAAATLHWNSYPGRIIDTLSRYGLKPLGVTMDSHEAGPQNWTPEFKEVFFRHNGYDITPFLPAMRGYIIEDIESTERFLSDLRRTIADAITDEYYGTFDSLCRKAGVQFTAQATGNGLSLGADNIASKRAVMKPQGEFWARDIHGSYDIIDCASAAHLYGKPIASGEAFTDAKFSDSPAKLKQLADFAYAAQINEFVVCASAYQPRTDIVPGNVANGRQYCLNRNNTIWSCSRPFWDYQARCAGMLRKGEPVVDILVYIGGDPPVKTLAHLLPLIPEGYNFDVCGSDVLRLADVENGELVLLSGMRYKMLVIQRNVRLSAEERQIAKLWEKAGLPVHFATGVEDEAVPPFAPDLRFSSARKIDDCVRFSHRRLPDADIYFIYNHSDSTFRQEVKLRSGYSRVYALDPLDGSAALLSGSTAFPLLLEPDRSLFLVATDIPIASDTVLDTNGRTAVKLDGTWEVTFDPTRGGPSEPVVMTEFMDWTDNANPAVKYYSGTATYRTSFDWKADGARHRLHISGLDWIATVKLNGRQAGTIWCSPWNLEIGHLLRDGSNTIEIEVTNSLYNRMIGDSSLKEDERFTHSSFPLVTPDTALIPSGISGGVEIF